MMTSYNFNDTIYTMSQVLLIGGSTGTMLEALQVLGDDHGHEHDHEQDDSVRRSRYC